MNENKFNQPFENLSKNIRIDPWSAEENAGDKTKLSKEAKDPEAEKRIITKPKAYLESVGITDYTCEEKDDGAHFYIKMSPENLKAKAKQARQFINAPDSTQLEKEKLIPFLRLMKNDKRFDCEFRDRPEIDSPYEIVVFKRRR